MARRIYLYRCHWCRSTWELSRDKDPGPVLCCECRHPEPISWWQSKSEAPFVPPDITGLRFGPTPEELAELGRPFSRRRDDADDMTVRFREPTEREAEAVHEQIDLFK